MAYALIEFDGDQKKIASLWEEAMGSHIKQRFDWLYHTPSSTPPVTVLLTDAESGQIVGCGSILKKKLLLNGKSFTVGVCIDFFVKAKHRTLGPAVMIQRRITKLLQTSPIDFLFAFPNQMALASFLRAGYRKLGTVETYVKLIRMEGKLTKILKFGILSRIAAFPLDALHRFYDAVRRLSYRNRYAAEIQQQPDDRFEELVHHARRQHPILFEKNKSAFTWRYTDMPGFDHRIFALTDNHTGELAGCLAFSIENRVALIKDIILRDTDVHLNPLMLHFFSAIRKGKNVDSIMICYIGDKRFLKQLEQLLFVRRTTDRHCLIHFHKDISDDVKQTIGSPENWFLFEGDMDI